MFSLISKVHMGRNVHRVGTLDEFLVSDDSEDDSQEEVQATAWSALARRQRKKEKLKRKINAKYIVSEKEKRRRSSVRKPSLRRATSSRRRARKVRLDPIQLSKDVKHHQPNHWNSPYDETEFYDRSQDHIVDLCNAFASGLEGVRQLQWEESERVRIASLPRDTTEEDYWRAYRKQEKIAKARRNFLEDKHWLVHRGDTLETCDRMKRTRGPENQHYDHSKHARSSFVRSCTETSLPPERLCFSKTKGGIEEIDLHDLSLGNKYCMILADNKLLFKNAKHINMRNNGISDHTMSAIFEQCVGKSHLRYLDMSGNEFGFKAAFSFIKMCNNSHFKVSSLRLQNVSMNDQTAGKMFESLGKLAAREWYIDHCPKTLKEWRKLTFGKLVEKKKMSPTERLQMNLRTGMKKLDKLAKDSAGCIDLEGFRGAQVNSKELRRVLGILRCKISFTEADALMTVFDKDGNGLIDYTEFVTFFFKRVRAMKKGIEYEFDHLPEDKVEARIPDRIIGSSLTYIDVSYNKLGANIKSAKGIANMITKHKSLKYLNLAWNCFDKRSGAILAKALASNTFITRVDLSWNAVGDEVGSFGAMLTSNSTLEELFLEHNGIPADACRIFSRGLAKNSTLRVLRLDGNEQLDDGAIEFLIKHYSGSSIIRELGLEDVPVETAINSISIDWTRPCKIYTFNFNVGRDYAVMFELLEMLRLLNGCVTCVNIVHRGKSLTKSGIENFIFGHEILPTNGIASFEVVPGARSVHDNEKLYLPFGRKCDEFALTNILQELKLPLTRFNESYFSSSTSQAHLKTQARFRTLILACKMYTFSVDEAIKLMQFFSPEDSVNDDKDHIGQEVAAIILPSLNNYDSCENFLITCGKLWEDNTFALGVENLVNYRFGFFPNNPTGSYCLHLERNVDRRQAAWMFSLASRRKKQTTMLQSHAISCHPLRGSCLRNVMLDDEVFCNYGNLPASGTLSFDFCMFSHIRKGRKGTWEGCIFDPEKDMNLLQKSCGITEILSQFSYLAYDARHQGVRVTYQEGREYLDKNSASNREDLNTFRKTYLILPQNLKHSHDSKIFCPLDCEMNPLHERYHLGENSCKLRRWDTVTKVVDSEIVLAAKACMKNIRNFFATNRAWVFCDAIASLLTAFSPLQPALQQYGFFVNFEILKSLFSRIIDAWNIMDVCRRYVCHTSEWQCIFKTFGYLNVINPRSKSINGGYSLDLQNNNERTFAQHLFWMACRTKTQMERPANWSKVVYKGQEALSLLTEWTADTIPKKGKLSLNFHGSNSIDQIETSPYLVFFHPRLDARLFPELAEFLWPTVADKNALGGEKVEGEEGEVDQFGEECSTGDRSVGCLFYVPPPSS